MFFQLLVVNTHIQKPTTVIQQQIFSPKLDAVTLRLLQVLGKTNLGIDRGGLYVSFIGDDGVRYYASHLRTIPQSIQPGVAVKVGRLLGTVGTTGSARGTKPHIHFGLSWSTPPQTWWVRRGMVWPWKYLDAWKAGKDLSPAKEVEAKRLKIGDLPPEPVNEKRK
jgi:murein DD-endopeptidase MepM/ murein hydrolase activator NlpD